MKTLEPGPYHFACITGISAFLVVASEYVGGNGTSRHPVGRIFKLEVGIIGISTAVTVFLYIDEEGVI